MSTKSILREIAELTNPMPADVDPEDIAADFLPSESEEEDDHDAGRDQYVEVSKLRGAETILKDSKYRGSQAQRNDLFQGPSLQDYKTADLLSDDMEEDDVEEDEEEETTSGEESASEEEDEKDDRRERVRDMLAQETNTVAKQISESVQADADKGKHIEIQQKFYDQLLDVRIRFQKVLTALNFVPDADQLDSYKNNETPELLQEAREQAYAIFLKTLSLNKQLYPDQIPHPNLKRKFVETSLPDIIESLDRQVKPIQVQRDEILTKWSDKVRTAQGLPLTKKFKALNTSITHTLNESLVDQPRLLNRLHTKRAPFARLGTKELDEGREVVDPQLFDDTDFYHSLLKDLVERKQVDITVGGEWKPKKVKVEKDVRASKGRKLRFHEHEKILNFMAPALAGTWHEDQIDELFAGLLGRQIVVDEDVAVDTEEISQDGLRIFG